MVSWSEAPEMAKAAADLLRPHEELTPAQFAERYRYLQEGTTHKPGRWSNEVYPYLVAIMNAVALAIALGKRGLVLMKSGQGGGSEGMINALMWLKVYFPGPMLYLISKDEVAREFGRERFGYIVETCEPLAKLALTGRKHGELIHIKRFTNGKLVIQGGRSVLNLESTPYRVVMIDELDSLQQTIEGKGDLVATAEIRTDAFPGETLIVCFAHPTTKDQGVGKLYYELSDQRRGFVRCIHCGEKFWLKRADVHVLPEGDETTEQAERNPERYVYVAPCCGCVITDGERYSMVAAGVEQISTLSEEEAAKKDWIGVHFSQFYMSNKPLALLARRWIAGIDKPSVRRVTVNKVDGDVYEETVRETTAEEWRGCIVVPRHASDPDAYRLGQVPPRVSFLTAGQDSRATELHWAVWGWGLVRNSADYAELCGWLIDAGKVDREKTPTIEAADLEVMRGLLYDRAFPRTDGEGHLYVSQGLHDYGWCPIAVWEFCRTLPGRAIPCRGEPLDSIQAPRKPFHRWASPPTWKRGKVEVTDPALRRAELNTYLLKEQLFGMIGRHFDASSGDVHLRISLPQDVRDDWIEQSSSEVLTKKKNKLVWVAKGPNHWSDCNIYAYAAALQLNPFQRGKTREDIVKAAKKQEAARARAKAADRRGRRGRRIRTRY